MFDIAFSEIVVIAVVALIVIGPERLPKTARTLGVLFGRLQRYVNDVKADISREMELDELRKLKQEVQTAATELQTSVSSAVNDLQTSARSVESELNRLASDGTPATTSAGGDMAATPATALEAAVPAVAREPLLPPPEDAFAAAVTPPPEAEPPRQASLPGLERP
jgi:sec-independent protein translocase protein TatB